MDKYAEYINSPEWRKKREERLKYDNYHCRACGSTEDLECHHVTYDHFGDEPIEDLITLCKECHSAITNSIRERRYRKNEIKIINIEKEESYHADTKSTFNWGITINLSQQSDGRPIELLFKRNKKDFWKTEEDRQ